MESRPIVVGVDGSDGSRTALTWAAEYAALSGSPLVAASQDARLLVVGQRGHGAFHDRLLGSMGEHCVHHARCPVVVVRGG